MQVVPLVTGWIRVDRQNFRPHAHSEFANFPVLAWLLRTSEGPVLFDCGPGSLDTCAANGRTHFRRTDNETLEFQLATLGVQLADIRRVVISHLHWDHAGRWSDFAPEVLVVPPVEVEFCVQPPEAHRRYFDSLTAAEIERLRAEARGFERSRDELRAVDIELVALPGHTPGSQGALLTLGERRVLLAGDTVPTLANLADGRLETNGISSDDKAAQASAQLIAASATDVLPSHDARMVQWAGVDILASLDEIRALWGTD